MARHGFASKDLRTRDNTARARGGQHYNQPHAPVRKGRTNHIHSENLGMLEHTHGVPYGQNMIMKHKGGDMKTFASKQMEAAQVGKHGVSLHNC